MRIETLGSDKRTAKKGIYLSLTFALIMFLLWVTANVPQETAKALIYSFIALTSVVFIMLDWLFVNKEFIDSVTYEDASLRPPPFDKIPFWLLMLIGLILVFYIFFSVSTTQYSYISAPKFQSTEFLTGSPFFRSMLSGIAGLCENLLFYAVLFPTLYSNLNKNKKVPFFISLFLAMILTSTVFMFFHFLVYGFSELTAFLSTFIFAFINCGLVFTFRNMFLTDIFHFFNNFFATWFATGARIAFVIMGGG